MRWAVLAGLAVMAPASVCGQQSLESAAQQFSRAWRAGDMDALTAMLYTDGILLSLGGESHRALPVRQARAALTDYLARRERGRVEGLEVRPSGGDPPMGSAEYKWETVVQGTSEPMLHTVFVGFQQVGEAWRISEIRVF